MKESRWSPRIGWCLLALSSMLSSTGGSSSHAASDPAAVNPPPGIQMSGIAVPGRCLLSEVIFDDSAVRAICLDPENVLQEIENFWDENETFRLVRLWHGYQDQPYSPDVWRERIGPFTKIPTAERERQVAFDLNRRLMSQRDGFRELAIPHICSFLPQTGIEFSTTIHFAIGTEFSGFAADNYIVVSITDPHWAEDPSAILNAMVHEVFHIGYGWNTHLRAEAPPDDRFLGGIAQKLHNEGMATYVAYRARSIFPAPHEADFTMLEDEVEVLASLDRLGKLFRQVELQRMAEAGGSQELFAPSWMPAWLARLTGHEVRMAPDELRRELWRVGVEQRAYYVGGAYMAKVIDEKLGRDALIATIADGPRSFIRLYNTLVDQRWRVHEFRLEETPSLGRSLREAALADDLDRFATLLARVRSEPPNDDWIQWYLWSTASLLRLRGRLAEAAQAYEAVLQLNSESADAHDGLATVHLQRNERESALMHFRKSMQLEPHRPLASRMVKELERAP